MWRGALPSTTELRTARRRLHLKALLIGAITVGSYWLAVIAESSTPVRFVAATALAFGLVAVGTGVMHDANHGSFSRRRIVNSLLAYSSDLLGASSWLWRTQHNLLHHSNTNVAGFDADIELAPFARLAPSQRWRPWHRAQHVYMWPLYGFLAMKNLLVSDVLTIAKRSFGPRPLRDVRGRRVVVVAAGKLVHIGWAIVLPLWFNPWWKVALFYVGCSWLVGFILAVTFQLAHCVDITEQPDATDERRGAHFIGHQLRTTANIDSGRSPGAALFRWLVGGLDRQIEHHLAPGLPHTAYRRVSERFRQACAGSAVVYRSHPSVWAGVVSHARWLRAMGLRPVLAS